MYVYIIETIVVLIAIELILRRRGTSSYKIIEGLL